MLGRKVLKGDKGDPGACNCSNTSLKSISEGSVFSLSDPYPNPIISSAKIDYRLGQTTSNCYLVFYDLKGVKIISMLLSAREGTIEITKSLLSAGTFMCRIENDESISTCKKIIIE